MRLRADRLAVHDGTWDLKKEAEPQYICIDKKLNLFSA
jgi:hypothetical protein